jgi:hypothetical protein
MVGWLLNDEVETIGKGAAVVCSTLPTTAWRRKEKSGKTPLRITGIP